MQWHAKSSGAQPSAAFAAAWHPWRHVGSQLLSLALSLRDGMLVEAVLCRGSMIMEAHEKV